MGSWIEYQRYIDTVDDWIVNRSKLVIVIFLVITAGFALGIGQGGTEAGTDQFVENIPAAEAFDAVNDNFNRIRFGRDTGSTQLVQTGTNVLAKHELLRMLRVQHRLQTNPQLQVTDTTSVASAVAQTLDPSANTLAAQITTVRRATRPEITRAVRATIRNNPGLQSSLSQDYNEKSARATATIGVVSHSIPPQENTGGPGTGGDSPLTSLQQHTQYIVSSVDGDITVFGSGLLAEEFSAVITDSMRLVIPAAIILIFVFLVIAYRDPFDLVLGLLALGMTVLWTFGFMGYAGIPFTQILIAVPPLLLAVGIDFGIHSINRYREERVQGVDTTTAMRAATDQLLVAFIIVTGTAAIGFLANMSSSLGPLREFGLVTAIGFVFTFLIFGIFLPATKVTTERFRDRYNLPSFATTPLGSSDTSWLARGLTLGVHIGRLAPRGFLILLVISTIVLTGYGAGVETEFSEEYFLPPADTPGYLEYVPEPLQPREYTISKTTDFLEAHFETGAEDTTTVYVEGPLSTNAALESMWRAGDSPPSSFITDAGHARETSIITVIQDHARRDPEFAALVARNDRNNNGIPDTNLNAIYGALLSSPARSQALNYITDDYTKARVQYAVKSDATADAVTTDTTTVAERYRLDATATGNIVVLKAVSDVIARSALVSLMLAISGSALFLIVMYTVFERKPSLGVANLIPIIVTVVGLAATMRALNIPFNVLTGTTLSIGVGLGTAYSVHITHRFIDEYDGTNVFAALITTVRGTGGALTGSLLTTISGTGVLVLAITPLLGEFGLLLALTICYSYLMSLIVLPPVLVVWAQYTTPTASTTPTDASNHTPPLGANNR